MNSVKQSISCLFISCDVEEWVGGSNSMSEKIGGGWNLVRSDVLVPLLELGLNVCMALSFFLLIEWILITSFAALANFFRKSPANSYKFEPMKDDLETDFPIVLVQIPIYNEIEVYKISIGAACMLSWPVDRLVVQVLDDSTDLVIKEKIEKECMRWASEGIDIWYQHRESRKGYKAGALKDGLKCEYVKQCEYVAIFDADFQPEPDFLVRALPFLIHNPDVALVQARWTFVNADECLLTRMQEITLNYQFVIEQEGGSSILHFFNFNGSGGVWRIGAIDEVGGWNDRTTVEDMDLAVRAGLNGWKFIFLGDLQVSSELPSNFKSYRFQQHRWSCGPANLFRKMVPEIVKNKDTPLSRKLYVIYNFFFIRKIVASIVVFLFYCVLLPLATLLPEVACNKWSAIASTFAFATLNISLSTPRSFYLAIPWVLFENIMSFHRTKALLIGLFEAKRANEWIVTEKLGDAFEGNSKTNLSAGKGLGHQLKYLRERILLQELGIASFLFACGCYDVFYGHDRYYLYLFLQTIFFTTAGFGYFGTIVPICPELS